MQEPLEKPSLAPIPKGWRRARRRRQRTFHEDFPALADKVRVFIALLLYGLTLAVFTIGPFAIYALAYFCEFAWDYDFKATELILLPLALGLLALGYAADPGIARRKKPTGESKQKVSLPRDRGRDIPCL